MRKRRTIGFLYNYQSPISSNNLLRGIEDYAIENDLNLLCAIGAPLDAASDRKRTRIFDFLDRRNANGVIMARKVGRSLNDAQITAFLKKFRPFPAVNIGALVKNMPSVSYSIPDSINEMVRHLVVDHAFKRILFVRGPEANKYARERYEAFCAIMKALKLRVHCLEPSVNNYYYEGGRDVVRILIEEKRERYEAIIAENNLMALGILDALRSYKIDVPHDIAVVGIYELEADNPFEIPITSVFVPFYDHGRIAARLCHDRMRLKRTPLSVTTPCDVRIGTTCGCFYPEVQQTQQQTEQRQKGAPGDVFSRKNRDAFLEEIGGIAEKFPSAKMDLIRRLAVILFEAFDEEIGRGRHFTVMKVLRASSGLFRSEGFDLLLMQKILALFYGKIISRITDPLLVQRASSLFYRAYYIIYRTVHNEESYRFLLENQKAILVGKLEEELLTAQTMERIRKIAWEKFPAFGVKSFFLALYEKPSDPSRLYTVFAHSDGKQVRLPGEDRSSRGQVFVRNACASFSRRFTLLAVPLFYGSEEMGIALFELSNNDLNALEKLRNGLSCALLNTFQLEVMESKTLDLEAEVLARNKALTAANLKLKREIAERRGAVVRLRRSEEQYRRWFKESFTADFVADPTGKITACNPAFARIFEFNSVAAALKANFTDFYPVASAVEDFFTLLKVVKRIEYYEAELVTSQGTRINIIGHIVGTFSKKGRLIEMRGYLVDNTPHKHMEEELRQSQKMEAIGRLSGGIAHDFNNLLTGIMGYSELLLQAISPENPARNEVEEIKKAAKSASSLTRQLLAFSRKQVLSPSLLDLNDIIRGMNEMLTRLIGETIHLHLDLNEAVYPVKADRGQIEQVIMNLVLNSRDALPSGGAITIRTDNETKKEAARLHNVLLKAGDYAVLEVIDNGSGMDEETQAHLFEPFFTTKTMGKGVGLGLSTVYGIVTQSAGCPEIKSRPGEGTRVRIYLPRHFEAVKKSESVEELADKIDLRGRVLVAEDDRNIRELTRLILSQKGFDVVMAEDGDDALKLYLQEKGKFDLVITDIVMPHMSGAELVKRIREEKKDVRVIYISGYTTGPAVQKLILDRRSTFLQKPFSPETLLQAIRRVL